MITPVRFSAFDIKLLAMIFMVIDHLGVFFFPQLHVLRFAGRLAFPLFAWLVATGAYHTHNLPRYALRLLLLAIVSQVPYLLANRTVDPSFSSLNVVFTLLLGLLAIYSVQVGPSKSTFLTILLMCMLTAHVFDMDYGYRGVLTIVCFYLFYSRPIAMSISQVCIALLTLFIYPGYLWLVSRSELAYAVLFSISGLLALPIIAGYNKKQGVKLQYVFYAFYPLQYVVFYVVKSIMAGFG